MTYEEAAAVPIGARTVLHFLRRASIKSGQKVLVYGASGSVGTFAVQLAKYYGAEVTGVCGGSNLELARSPGADAAIDYTEEDFADKGETYDVVFVAVDKGSFPDCMKALRRKDTYLNATTPVRTLRMRWAAPTSGKKIITGEHPSEEAEVLRSAIDRRYPLEQIVEAHHYADQGHKKGSVVITIE